jgi:hypothetical protein
VDEEKGKQDEESARSVLTNASSQEEELTSTVETKKLEQSQGQATEASRRSSRLVHACERASLISLRRFRRARGGRVGAARVDAVEEEEKLSYVRGERWFVSGGKKSRLEPPSTSVDLSSPSCDPLRVSPSHLASVLVFPSESKVLGASDARS